MSLHANQWDHIGLIAQRPSADNFSEGYTYLASDAAVGFVVSTKLSGGQHFWQQIFCQCWTQNTPTCSIKNISGTNQTLPAAYGSITLPPNQSILLPDDAQWASYVLRSNGVSTSNFAIGPLFQDCPLDVAVYVDGANGNDTNPGTQALPVATIRQGFRLWPKHYSRTCNMFVSNTTQESAEDLIVYPPTPVGADAQPPCIIGNMVDVGLGTLTVQSFTPNATPNATSAGDAVVPTTGTPLSLDLYAGQEYYATSGPFAGRAYTIMNNSTGAFFLPHASHNGQPAPGQTFQIRKPSSTITLTGGQFEVRSGQLAMYGLTLTQTTPWSLLIVQNSTVYADSVRFIGMYVEVFGGGIFAPGLAHDVCSLSGLPIISPSTVGIFSNIGVYGFGGDIGQFLSQTVSPDTTPGLLTGVLVIRIGPLFMQGGMLNMYVADVPQVNLWGLSFFNVIQHWRINGSTGIGLAASATPVLSVSQVDISGCASDAINLDDGAFLSGSIITGSGNGGVGLRATHCAKADVSTISVTGTGGDVKVGSNTVDTWANIAGGNASHTTDFNASSTGVATSQGCRVGP